MPAMPTGKSEPASAGLWRTDRMVLESIVFAVPPESDLLALRFSAAPKGPKQIQFPGRCPGLICSGPFGARFKKRNFKNPIEGRVDVDQVR